MEIKVSVLIEESKTTIQFGKDNGTIDIIKKTNKEIVTEQPAVCLTLKDRTVVGIGQSADQKLTENEDVDHIIAITPSWEIELAYLEQFLLSEAEKSGKLIDTVRTEKMKIPANRKKAIAVYGEEILTVLHTFGYELHTEAQPVEAEEKSKPKPAKARHRWSKAVSEIEFVVDTRESKATVVWQKRNEMLLKAGAKMMPSAPLNKDGSLGFAAKMGEKIRADHADQIKNFKTTEDIILKSVNEVGLFLYFGGTNSWLEMFDKDGKTINEWTVVE
ncbi:hypothetical protein I6N96_07195 [Enterococcus sp. BWM-S5]|uniref:Uncharacterized protein n=1 Tax=Enterococcus larvae TaxID=2794352 RepID=A0ABS4CHG6_9ENTE|nr:hypothetical protein [Enterococcus larvae]MBP1046064.1 hypothetical protein [Enterococcus larvae]